MVIPSLQAGGMERVMSEIAWYFSTLPELKVSIVLYGKSREVFYPLPENITLYKPRFAFSNKFRFLFTIRTLFYLRSTVKKIKPDSLLSFGEYWNSFVLLSLIGCNIPVYVSDRSQPDKSLGYIHDRLRNLLYPRAKGVIAQTKKAKEIFHNMYEHDNITVIGNPIRQISEHKRKDIVRENIVLMVGRLINTKHQDRLIRIFLDLDIPDWQLILVGYDHLKQHNSDKLSALIEKNGAQNKVILAGKQEHVDLYYLRSKIFAFTSSSEGFPNVIGEAMSAGLPVVAYDCIAGPSEMIKDGLNGYLTPLFDDQLFKTRLKELMTNEEKRKIMGENAEVSIQSFNNREICRKFQEFMMK